MAELIIRNGKHTGKKLILPGRETLVGRDEQCGLRLTSPDVSKQHCVLRITPEGIHVRDLESRNGTWVNDQRIEGEVLLRPGDQLRVGPMMFQVPVRKPEPQQFSASRPDDRADPPSDDDITSWLSDETGTAGTGDTTIITGTAAEADTQTAAPPPDLPSAERTFHTVAEEAADIIRRWQQRQTARPPQSS